MGLCPIDTYSDTYMRMYNNIFVFYKRICRPFTSHVIRFYNYYNDSFNTLLELQLQCLIDVFILYILR